MGAFKSEVVNLFDAEARALPFVMEAGFLDAEKMLLDEKASLELAIALVRGARRSVLRIAEEIEDLRESIDR